MYLGHNQSNTTIRQHIEPEPDLLEQFDSLLGPDESTRIVPEHDCPASVDGNRSAAEVGTFSRASGDPHGRTREAACRRELEPLLECRQLVNLV